MLHTNRYIIAIGSNFETIKNIGFIRATLQQDFAEVKFSPFIETEPINMPNDFYFVNGLAAIESSFTITEMTLYLKEKEKQSGKNEMLKKQGIIPLDLDILMHNDTVIHNDWERGYIQKLLPFLSV